MKCITKLKITLQDNHGYTYLTAILCSLGMLSLVVLICILLRCFIICGDVKKTTIQEMNNLSNIIVVDIFDVNKQGSLTEYNNKLNSSAAYRNYLFETTLNNISSSLALQQNNNIFTKYDNAGVPVYYLSQFNLQQENKSDRIKYTISFTVTLNFRFCGEVYNGFVYPVSYDTYHIKNY